MVTLEHPTSKNKTVKKVKSYKIKREILKKIEEQNVKIDAIYVSVEKTRKYFQWTLIITVATIVVPVLAAAIILPMLMSSLSGMMGGLGL